MEARLSELAAHVGGEVVGDGSLVIRGVGGLAEAGPADLSFFGGSNRYQRELEGTRAGALLVPRNEGELPKGRPLVRVDVPHLAFARISALFNPPRPVRPGIRPLASVHPQAQVDPSAEVMDFATVEKDAVVGPRTVLYPGAYVGEGARIGADCMLYPNVTVRERCMVGARVILHASAVVGADGFGFVFDPAGPAHVKVPQAGIARIEDDVEVGANSCVDRGTTGETVVGRGTKVDNLVQIAHNVKVGPLSILCAQVGISGSAELGSGVVLAGQVGVVGHIKLGNMVRVGAQSGVGQSVPDGEAVSGSPAVTHRHWLRGTAATRHLPDLLKEVRELKRKVEAMEKAQAEHER